MKKIYIIALLVMSMASCSKWLDITPNDTIVEGALFKESAGFHNALNGIYRKMSDTKLYGQEMTFGFTEVLSQNYYITTNSAWYPGISKDNFYFQVARFEYTTNENVKSCIDGMWRTAFETIANCNNLIVNIEPTGNSIYRDGLYEKEMIKGEALAVRAFIHFDMLRMFGTAPIKKDSRPTIPYLTTFPYYGGQAAENSESILKKVEADLLQAKSMLMRYDTLDADRRDNLSSYRRFTLPISAVNNSAFYNYRGYRMNCMAITATLARVYNYWGKHDLAIEQAKIVEGFASSYSNDGPNSAFIYDKTSASRNDKKFTKDLIFAVGNSLTFSTYIPFTAPKGSNYLGLNPAKVIFKGGNSDAGDLRYKNLVVYDSSGDIYVPKKYVSIDPALSEEKMTSDILPSIRLAEMHFIMAECYASQNDFIKAEEYINIVRAGRNCAVKQLGITDMTSFKRELFIEVRKEFFQEGQIFFYYKKYDEPLTKTMTTDLFVIPVPDSEKIN